MAAPSGLAAQIGFDEEAAWGTTDLAVAKFLPLISESLKQEKARLDSKGIIAGARVERSTQWQEGAVSVKGDVQFELSNQTIGLLFKHCFGTVGTTGPVSSYYTHTFSPASLTGLGLTFQVGRPGTDGTVQPFSYTGCKVASWELGLKEGERVTMGLSLIGKHETRVRVVTDGVTNTDTSLVSATAAFTQDDKGKPISGSGIPAATTIATVTNATTVVLSAATTATAASVTVTIGIALASASYASTLAGFVYQEGTITVAGSTVAVPELTLSGDNGLEERRFVGSQFTSEPLETKLREYTGSITIEYAGNTQYGKFVNGTEGALVVTLVKGSATVTITCNVRFDGETPTVNGTGRTMLKAPFKCLGPTTDASAITAVLVNLDSTA